MPNTQPSPRYDTPTLLWQMILRELQGQVSKVTYDTWLAGSTVLAKASTENALIVVVGNVYAAHWLTYRLHPVVARTAVAVAGKPVVVCFIPRAIRNNECDNPPSFPCSNLVFNKGIHPLIIVHQYICGEFNRFPRGSEFRFIT